jgi:hypothetical protein
VRGRGLQRGARTAPKPAAPTGEPKERSNSIIAEEGVEIVIETMLLLLKGEARQIAVEAVGEV